MAVRPGELTAGKGRAAHIANSIIIGFVCDPIWQFTGALNDVRFAPCDLHRAARVRRATCENQPRNEPGVRAIPMWPLEFHSCPANRIVKRRSTNQPRNKAKGRTTHDPSPRRRRFSDDPRAHGGVAPGTCTDSGATTGSTGAAASISHAERAGDTQRAVACSEDVGQPTLPGLTRETQTLATLIASEQSDRLQAAGGGWNSLTCNPPHFRVRTFYPVPGTHVSNKDRDFRPAWRRAFADDNYEALWSNFGSAPEFSAQRFEAPSGPPTQAVVKWYNPDKGFGFVQLADGSGDAFLHASVVERSGHGSVPPGATLEIRAGSGAKGPQVTEILSIDTSTASQEPPRRGRPERPIYSSDNQAAVEEIGTVKWYNAMKGFGFIGPDMGGKDIFVHATVLNRAGIADLAEGQRVAVDVVDGRKGPEAASCPSRS